MPETLLLDTTVVVDLLRGNSITLAAVGSLENHFLPSVTVGELYHGAYRSTRVLENARQIELLVAACEVLPCDDHTARQYGHLKHVLSTSSICAAALSPRTTCGSPPWRCSMISPSRRSMRTFAPYQVSGR